MPVYWKPRYPTRSMRERAWAKQSAAREARARQARGDSSLLKRLRRIFRR